ncbi:MAG: pyridoxal-phosphate dependent enzyme [Actinomycetia bacterium]|nr:pyridoxal-phosphate dependent enzyme [Actinomycetes bacterium]
MLSCLRCRKPGTGYEGCSVCAAQGVYVNLAPPPTDLTGYDLGHYRGGLYEWRHTLPIAADVPPVTLGEGNTPSVPLHVDPGSGPLAIKNEAANPTWSHKDRGMSAALTKAREIGATTVVIASSGNAGAAAAAYSARAGLDCIVLTTVGIPPVMERLLAGIGATLIGYRTGADRNRMLAASVRELGWYPAAFTDDRVGGNPYGNEGFKSIAYELARDHGDELQTVVVPVSKADLMSGIGRGFQELHQAGLIARMPALVAAEAATGAAFTTALSNRDPEAQERTRVVRHESLAWSIGNNYAFFQGLDVLRVSGGHAVAVDQDRYLAERERVGHRDGLFVEISSAVAIAAAREIAWSASGLTVAISTSTGIKDPALPGAESSLTVLEPTVERLHDWVARNRGSRRK